MKNPSIDFDGKMPECLGADCPSSCCKDSKVRMEPAIYGKRDDFEKIIESGAKIIPHIDSNLRSDRFLIFNCQNSDGSCKLEDLKPVHCRIYPFGLDAAYPFGKDPDKICPQVKEIASNKETVEKIMEIRKALRYSDNDTWRGNLEELIRD